METKISTKTKRKQKQGFLAPSSPTLVTQMASFVAGAHLNLNLNLDLDGDGHHDDQVKAKACLCIEDTKEKEETIVDFANLFDFEYNQAKQCELEKSSDPKGCTINVGGGDAVVSKIRKNRSVSFAPSHQVIQLADNQTEGRKHELWYSRYDFMLFEDEACLCSQMIRQSETFEGDLGHILGLEKIILCDSYFDRRDALRTAVLEEQAVHQMFKELRSSQGYSYEPDDISLMQLADTSERLSLWARERASMTAFTLEHDLTDHTKTMSEPTTKMMKDETDIIS